MPTVLGPRAFGNAMPPYMHDWADLLAQEEADEADKNLAQREQNRTRLRPSSVEIALMEHQFAGRCYTFVTFRSWSVRYRRLLSPRCARGAWRMQHASLSSWPRRAALERRGMCSDCDRVAKG
jgi:hypothetical protein